MLLPRIVRIPCSSEQVFFFFPFHEIGCVHNSLQTFDSSRNLVIFLQLGGRSVAFPCLCATDASTKWPRLSNKRFSTINGFAALTTTCIFGLLTFRSTSNEPYYLDDIKIDFIYLYITLHKRTEAINFQFLQRAPLTANVRSSDGHFEHVTSALDALAIALRCRFQIDLPVRWMRAAATQRSQERDQFVGCLNFVGDSLRRPHRAFNAFGTARARHSGISKSLRTTDRQTFRFFACAAARSRRASGENAVSFDDFVQ